MGGQVDAGELERARFSGDFGTFRPGSSGFWLVLGGGGLKGMAHIGALQALEEEGLEPRGIVGTSIGALVGVLYSSGMGAADMRERAAKLSRRDIARLNRGAIWINGIREVSVLRGDVLREYLEDVLPEAGWGALRIPVLVNAVDLADGSTRWFGPGAEEEVPLVDAVYASAALPVFYPPLIRDGKAYVDGGIMRSLPIGRAQEEGAERIVGIDVGSGEKADAAEIVEQGLVAIHQRVVSIMTWQRRYDLVSAWKGAPLLYVRPRLEGYGTFDFDHVDYFLDEGYRAMREALDR